MNQDPNHTLVVGMTGSGKTTFVIRYLLNAPAVACRFVFDWNERIVPRLPLRPCFTETDCENALASRWVIFQPRRMFPGAAFDRKTGREALRWFCAWVRAKAKAGPGRKIFAVAELWNFCTEDAIPAELAMLAQDGRQDGVEFLFDTQEPHKLNSSIVSATTELVCFRLDERKALRAVSDMGADAERVNRLPLGAFVAKNRLCPDETGILAGRLW